MNPSSSKATWRADRRIYLDKDGKVVTEPTQDPHTLLVGENGEIPLERAQALGLVEGFEPEGPAEPEPIDLEALALSQGMELAPKGRWESAQASHLLTTQQRDGAMADLAKANSSIAAVTKERDDAKHKAQTLTTERDGLKTQLAAVTKERDDLKKAAPKPAEG